MNNYPYNLGRFISAQEGIFESVLTELENGRKQTHWMWFIFPQIDGLGFSSTTRYYAIKSLEEARQYRHHPVLGARLLQCTGLVLAVEGKSANEIFGSPDDMKLKSCMPFLHRRPARIRSLPGCLKSISMVSGMSAPSPYWAALQHNR